MMKIKIVATKKGNNVISRHIHSVFFEYFGHVIYDGIWVGRESSIPNIDGLRKDVVEGCKELGIGAMRWPGGCCADHYHWKNGIGKSVRQGSIPSPIQPIPCGGMISERMNSSISVNSRERILF